MVAEELLKYETKLAKLKVAQGLVAEMEAALTQFAAQVCLIMSCLHLSLASRMQHCGRVGNSEASPEFKNLNMPNDSCRSVGDHGALLAFGYMHAL